MFGVGLDRFVLESIVEVDVRFPSIPVLSIISFDKRCFIFPANAICYFHV